MTALWSNSDAAARGILAAASTLFAAPRQRAELRLRLRFHRARAASRAEAAAGTRYRRATLVARHLVVRLAGDLLAAQQGLHLVAGDRLVLHQRLGDGLEVVPALADDPARRILALGDDAADLLVDQPRRVLRHVLALRDGVAEEDLLLVLVVAQRPELLAHAPLGDHAAGKVGRLHDVARGTGVEVILAVDRLLGATAAERHGDARLAPLLGVAELVPLRQVHGHAQRPAARDDRHLVQRIAARNLEADQRMAGLVVGGGELLLLGHDHGAALRTHHHLVLGVFELELRHETLVAACGEQRRLVDAIGEIGARETGRTTRDDLRIDVRRDWDLAHMHAQDLLAAGDVRVRHSDLPV